MTCNLRHDNATLLQSRELNILSRGLNTAGWTASPGISDDNPQEVGAHLG